MAILSIQSHVAFGHVGNRAAVFALERMGYEVWPINTVQFSNHKGYESWTGEIFTAAHLGLVWSGVKAIGCIAECEAVLSGYLGSAEIGSLIMRAVGEVKTARASALYCCDPVMGDYGKGFFVDEATSDFIMRTAVPAADIVTPNQFEAEALSGEVIASIDDAKRACEAIHALGPGIVLVTSFMPEAQDDSSISMFLSSKEGFHLLTTPMLGLDPTLRGAGDLCSALFLGHLLAGKSSGDALEFMGDTVFAILERTSADKSRELRLIQTQDRIATPCGRFEARKV